MLWSSLAVNKYYLFIRSKMYMLHCVHVCDCFEDLTFVESCVCVAQLSVVQFSGKTLGGTLS